MKPLLLRETTPTQWNHCYSFTLCLHYWISLLPPTCYLDQVRPGFTVSCYKLTLILTFCLHVIIYTHYYQKVCLKNMSQLCIKNQLVMWSMYFYWSGQWFWQWDFWWWVCTSTVHCSSRTQGGICTMVPGNSGNTNLRPDTN